MTTGWQTDLASLGPYFAVDAHPAGASVPAPWRTFEELVSDPATVRERVEAIRQGLAAMGGLPVEAVESRVAASVAHLAVAARLVSPVLAVAVSRGIVLDLAPAETWWRPVPGGPVPVSVRSPQPAAAGPNPADLVAQRVLDGPVRALNDAFARLSVSRRILWGNVASAVHGAATMLDRQRPEWTVRTRAVTAALRGRKPLAGAGDLDVHGRFRRHSCCLIYRAAPGATGPVCGDCVLAARARH